MIYRINSDETAEDTGLFVTIDFKLAKRYAYSNYIVEFTANLNDLYPVKNGASGTYNFKTGYDNLLSQTKSEALFRGDINPNMIKYIWKYNSKTYTYDRYNRKDFIRNFNIKVKKSRYDLFLPNDDFDINKIINLYNGNTNSDDFKRYIFKLKTFDESMLSKVYLFPKQIKQVLQLRSDGYFEQFI